MTPNFFKALLFGCLLTLATCGISQSTAMGQSTKAVEPSPTPIVETKSLVLGLLDGVNYTNNYFGLSLSVPQSWTVVNAQRVQTVVDQVHKTITADQQKKEQIDESVQRSVVLLSLTKVPAGQPDNASFMLVAERIPVASMKTGADVVVAMKSALTGTNVNTEFLGETQTQRIGGADFAIASVKNTSPAGTFMQKVYVTTKNGYALELFYTYLNEADVAAFDSIVATVKVK